MCDPGKRKAAETHKTVARSTRPTRFDRQTSHTAGEPQQGALHSCTTVNKCMGRFALDMDVLCDIFGTQRDIDERLKQSLGTNFPDRIVCGFQREIVGNVVTA